MNGRLIAGLGVVLLAGAGVGLYVYLQRQMPGLGQVPPQVPPAREQPESAEDAASLQAVGQELPVLQAFPEFSLADQAGAPYGTDQLWGKAWIVQVLSAQNGATLRDDAALFAELAKEVRTRKLNRDVRLVSLVVEAGGDESIPSENLVALTSDNDEVWKVLAGAGDLLRQLDAAQWQPSPSAAAGLATKWALVDPQGFLRGWYDGKSAKERETLLGDVQRALAERVMVLGNKLASPLEAANVLAPPWLQGRRRAQLASRDQLRVFHDFSFTDRRRESGITFRHRMVDDAGRLLVTAHYDHGNGVSIADVDGDGWQDVYFVNQVGRNELWRNLGAGKFEDITEQAGVGLPDRICVAASFADIDNDGDSDLYVTSVRGGNALFENDGHGVFRDISQASGLDYVGHSSSAEFFDYDRDGRLDLFLVNVGVYTTERVVTVATDHFTGPDRGAYTYYASNPDAFAAHLKPQRAERSLLFRNLGENRFADVTDQTQLVDLNWTGDASPLDGNADGWPDLYLVNMQGHDEYYENVEGQRFVRKGREVFPATPWGAMGIKVLDIDNDGHMDIFLTDMHTDMAINLSPIEEKKKVPSDAMDPDRLATDGNHVWGNALFHNEGNGKFTEVSAAWNAETYWPWGLSSGDVNADGYEDVFVTAGMNFPYRYGVNSVLLNNEGREFRDAEFILGVEPRRGERTAVPWFEIDTLGQDREHPAAQFLRAVGVQVPRAVLWGSLGSRSSVIFDLDNDGDLDIVTNDFNSQPMVLVSNLAERRQPLHYLQLHLVGTQSNRDGLGARVRVQTPTSTYTKVHDGQSGYLSQSALPLYFGLGESNRVEQIEILWPSGQTQVLPATEELNRMVEVREP